MNKPKRIMKEWWKEKLDNEYTLAEVRAITGWSQYKIQTLKDAGTIIQTRKAFYDKASVDAYQKAREERLAIMEKSR